MKNILLKIIVFYQKIFSKPGVCRFSPSCSKYAYEVINKEGVFCGVFKSFKRVIRCNGFVTPVVGTYDPVK